MVEATRLNVAKPEVSWSDARDGGGARGAGGVSLLSSSARLGSCRA
jgi:hypothetical protein